MSGESGATLILNVSTEVAGHIAMALRRHREWAARVAQKLPPEIKLLEASFISRATEGQYGTRLDGACDVGEPVTVTPKLATYEQAADLLACSVRTVKRLLAAGDLVPIRLGGAARIRVSDLDALIEQRAAEARKAG